MEKLGSEVLVGSYLLHPSLTFPSLGLASLVLVLVSALLLYVRHRGEWQSKSGAPATNGKLQKTLSKMDDPNKPRVLLLYGTQTGTAERFAKQLKNEMQARYTDRTRFEIMDIEEYKAEEKLKEEHLVFFLMATYGDGEPTDNAADFYNWLLQSAKDAESGTGEQILQGVSYGVFGLGNKQYEHFCAVGKKIFRSMKALGAKPIARRGDGDDDEDIDADFEGWRTDLFAAMDSSSLVDNKEGSRKAVSVMAVDKVPAFEVTILTGEEAKEADPFGNGNGLHANTPYAAPISLVRELHLSGSDRSCIHAELDISGSDISYEAGDHVGVYASNAPEVVAEAATLLGVSPAAIIELSRPEESELPQPPFAGRLALGVALAKFADLLAPAHKASLQALAAFASPEDPEAQRLVRLVSPEGKEEYQEWVAGPSRSLLEVMAAFPTVKPSLGAFFGSIAPRLQPRFYSISSSPKPHARSIHVTCALVRETVPSGRLHLGIASGFLAAAASAPTRAHVFVRRSHFKLPREPRTPVVMVGPGTGLAPFRGFLQERAALKAAGKELGPAVLFFGCRKRAHDYIYEAELTEFLNNGVLTDLHLAFSRDGEQKEYVQHHMERRGSELWSLLEAGGYLYVCGDAKQMARDVHRTLTAVVKAAAGCTGAQAERKIKELTDSGRYQRDVW